MRAGVADQFALLLADKRPPGPTGLLTRRAGLTTVLGPVLVGTDVEARRHLLVPISDSVSADDRVSSGIDLTSRELVVGGDVIRFADLYCRIPRLSKPFEQLVEDILGRLHKAPDAGLGAVLSALDDWRALLRRGLDSPSREEVLGLVGELEVMGLLARVDPVAAVDGWTGPDNQSRDFRRLGRDIEVKASSAVIPSTVRISNLDQLDPDLSSILHLAVAHLAVGSDAPHIEERIDGLLELGVPGDVLETKLREFGYFRGMEVTVPSRYHLRELRWWKVDSSFPGLRSSLIDESRLVGIDHVSYDLVLGALPPALTTSSVVELVEEWCS